MGLRKLFGVNHIFSFFRSRRPEAKPSTSLVLQLMDFQDALKNSSHQKSTKINTKTFLELDWRAKAKLAVPLTIYFLILAVVFRMLYSVIFENGIFDNESDEEGELVCY